MKVLKFSHDRNRLAALEVGSRVKCRLTSQISQIVSIQGSWVELLSERTRQTIFLSTYKIYQSYVE